MHEPKYVLTPYSHRQAGRARPLSFLFITAYCAGTGALVALLPAELLFSLALPIIVAVGVILWLLPNGGRVPEKLLGTLMVWWLGINCLWPNYISLDLPGLPWINPPRIVTFLLVTLSLIAFSSSSSMRAEVSRSLNAIPALNKAFWIFWGMTLITIPLSGQPLFSINRWVNNQIFWTFMFVLSAWIAAKPGALDRLSRILVWSALIVSLEGLYEYAIKMVPWVNSIPSWLKVDATLLGRIYDSQSRAGTDVYRVRGTFNVSLTFAEYLAMIFPLMIHFVFASSGALRKALMFMALIATASVMYLTNARSGMIGFFMSVILYFGFAAFRHWRQQRNSLVGISALAMLPIAAGIFVVLMLTWPRLHNMTLGGGQHQASSEARERQWSLGTPMVLANPIGHGPGRSGAVLGYTNLGGEGTIDSYYLSALLEYGVVGFIAFLAMFGGQLYFGLPIYVRAARGEESLAGPITVALTNFVVIKLVLSSEFNIPLAFVLLGFLFAIALRQNSRLAPEYGFGIVPSRDQSPARSPRSGSRLTRRQ